MNNAPAPQPALRFSGFGDDSAPIKLLEVCDGAISNGVFNDPNKRDGAFRLVNVLDMFGTDQINVDALTHLHIDQKEYERNEVKYGDIFFTRSSLVAAGIAWSNVFLAHDENVTFDGHLMKISPDLQRFSPAYLAQYFRSRPIRKQLIVRGKTGTMTTIGQADIASVELRTPALPEQRKIADFLTAVDGRIQQLSQKKALLQDYKKGVMQQLFTQALRFKDDHGNDFPDWEEKTLGDVVGGISSGKTKPSDSGEYPIYGSTGLLGHSSTYTHDEECVLVARVGANAGLVNRVCGKYSVTDNTLVVSFDETTMIASFAESFLRAFSLSKLVFGTGQPLITGGQLNSIKIALPSLPEQTKIANFLTALDRKIESVSQQIALTQTFKRGLLQQMFV